ncbi:MAG: phosphohydrolase, partial [Candidatus Magasanikbacteria bacterium]|nr:phosphohydrolase [Candidatus Magasanikbacteria bacterium]
MNKREREIFVYTYKKVKTWLKEHPAPGHDFEHADRVARYAIRLARRHGGNIFLSALSGL